jgi:hypothetical protein
MSVSTPQTGNLGDPGGPVIPAIPGELLADLH